MTSSRSTNRASKLLVVIAALVFWMGAADAAGRKRIVVLEFEGPKAEKFHDELVKLIKKNHTVVPTDKWNSTADELDAGSPTDKNIKKVAKKLKVDGIVTGKIEKRRDEYILRLKLHAGTTGEAGNSIETKAEGPRLDGKAQRDLKDELIGALDDLEANHGGSDDEEDKPAHKPKKVAAADDEDEKPAHKPKKAKDGEDDEDEAPKHSGFSKSKRVKDDAEDEDKPKKTAKKDKDKDAEDEDKPKKAAKKDKDAEDEDKPKKTAKKDSDEEDKPKKAEKSDEDEEDKPKKHSKSKDDESDDSDGDGGAKKRTAKAGDEDESTTAEADVDEGVDPSLALSPTHRALEIMGGVSLTARRLGFKFAPNLPKPPPGYNQTLPVGGAFIEATVYPLVWGHKGGDKGAIGGLGATLVFDRVLSISSQKQYIDATTGNSLVASQATTEQRFALGAVYRYPLGKGANAAAVGGKLLYGKQSFEIKQLLPDNLTNVDIPNVEYTYFEPGAFIRYPAAPKITLDADLGLMVITDVGTGAGSLGNATMYGPASALGVEIQAGGEYLLTKNLFLRAIVRFETVGSTFKNNPMAQTNQRDSDQTTQDVGGAQDTFFGGSVTVGYLY